MAGTLDVLAATLLTASVGFMAAELARLGDLGPGIQQAMAKADANFAALFGGSATGTSGAGKPGCFDSTTMSLPSWVGVLWCKTHTAPPSSPDDLSSWGNQNGYRDSSGKWNQPAGTT